MNGSRSNDGGLGRQFRQKGGWYFRKVKSKFVAGWWV